jgi:hypothetical protein
MTSYESYRLRRLLAKIPSARVNCMTDASRGLRLGAIGGGSTFKAQTSLLKPFLYTTKKYSVRKFAFPQSDYAGTSDVFRPRKRLATIAIRPTVSHCFLAVEQTRRRLVCRLQLSILRRQTGR